MAEGGQPPIVYNFENVETVNVIHEQNVTNIEKSSVGSIAISSKSGGHQQGEAFIEDDGLTESEKLFNSKYQNKEPDVKETDITWLQKGKFGLYVKKPLHADEKVYRGVQKLMSNTRRDVAIKRLVYKDKRRKEVDLLLKLQHPNIVQIIDAFDQRSDFHWIYIVMELCSQNLQEYIDENKLEQRDFNKLYSFSKQLVAGLAYLHQNKVVHRDLKPENILISMCKNFIKLSDFGLSREIQESRSVATVTTIGAGSEGFRSPETYQTGSQISPRLDIFPLGLILHFLFANGLHPFGPDPYDWRDNIRKNKNLDLSQIPEFVGANVPKRKQLIRLLNRMLQHEPRDRPTAEEVTKDSFFEDLPRESGKTIDEQVATINISSSITSSPPREASTDTTNSLQERGSIDISSSRSESPSSKNEKVMKLEESSVNDQAKSIGFSQARAFWKQKEYSSSSRRTSSEATTSLHRGKIENIFGAEKVIKELEERASNMMAMREFRKATEVLHELVNYDGSHIFESSLKIAECEINLQRGQEQVSIQRVKDVASTSRLLSAGELQAMAEKSQEGKNYVQSLILLHVSYDVSKVQKKFPIDMVIWIADLTWNISVNAKPLIEAGGVSRSIGVKYGLEYMERLLNELRLVKIVKSEARALNEVKCLANITYICIIAGEFRRSLSFCKDGIVIMEEQFGEDVSNYWYYGAILENTADSLEGCGDYSLAEKYYVAALKGYRKAEDLTEDDRRENIDRTTDLLNRVRGKIQ